MRPSFFEDAYGLIGRDAGQKVIDFMSKDHPVYVFAYTNVDVAFVTRPSGLPSRVPCWKR